MISLLLFVMKKIASLLSVGIFLYRLVVLCHMHVLLDMLDQDLIGDDLLEER